MNATYASIPKFTRGAGWQTTVEWKYLPTQLDHWINDRDGLAQLDLNPDFQRAHVWTTDQQISYVEYVLRGGLSGREIYFNCVGWMGSYKGPFVLVDGKQRLEAVSLFLRDELPIFGQTRRSDYTDRLPNEATFTFHVNNLPTRADVLRWYLEMNTGGTPHTREEIAKVEAMLKVV
jgi:hypothetical protein